MRTRATVEVVPPETRDIEVRPMRGGTSRMRIETQRGDVDGILHAVEGATAGVIMVGGVGGGFNGPARIYPALAEALVAHGIPSLRLDFRHPNDLSDSAFDVVAGIEALSKMGVERVALVGWSFGGAVAITAGAIDHRVAGVATVASQSDGTDMVSALAPRPILLLHETGDRTLPPACSRDIYERAGEPRDLELYPRANHGLDQVRDQAKERLQGWLLRVLGGPKHAR